MSSSRKRAPEEEGGAAEKKRPKATQTAYYGLCNQGSTCYLNSVLQVLFMTTEMHSRLDPNSHTDEALRKLFDKLKEAIGTTERIIRCLEIKNVNQQQDAAECLETILHKLSPKASKVFQGEQSCRTTCLKGHRINEETNPFRTLPLSLRDADETTYSVEKNFRGIFKKKEFMGDNKVFCNQCKEKTEATYRCEMVQSPHILILLLKRFDFDVRTMSHIKSERCVDVPAVLETETKTYKLYGMVNHMGSLAGGHYTATILSKEDKTWYEFNDTRVKKAEDQPFAQNRTYKSSAAYLIAYRASRRPREKQRGRPDENSHSDGQQGNKKGSKSRSSENDTDGDKREKLSGEERVLLRQSQSSSNNNNREQRSKDEEGLSCPSITRKHLLIAVGVFSGVLVVIVIAVVIAMS